MKETVNRFLKLLSEELRTLVRQRIQHDSIWIQPLPFYLNSNSICDAQRNKTEHYFESALKDGALESVMRGNSPAHVPGILPILKAVTLNALVRWALWRPQKYNVSDWTSSSTGLRTHLIWIHALTLLKRLAHYVSSIRDSSLCTSFCMSK